MAFAVFARHRNFTRAAEELFISQPALHQKVSKLSEELDVPLYVRNGRELTLTEEGRIVAAHAREVGSLTEDVIARLDASKRRGTVALASGAGAFLHLIEPVIPRARKGPFPLRLLTMRGHEAAEAVRQARAHVAVGVFEGNRHGLECHPWLDVDQMLVVPADHRLAGHSEVVAADLEGESLIVPPEGHPNRVKTERVLSGVTWHNAVEALGYELAIAFVGHRLGVTIMNDFVNLPDGFVGIPMLGFPTVTFEVAVREGTPHEGARWLCDLLLGANQLDD
ncbi:LysR family transcriptional regulator [Persicimonas caeni]|nr:LysR family transcriptional regulator [Persicimonas caeni]